MTGMIVEALSGLGMFLFGMYYMELALKEAAGLRFKNWVRHSTSSTMKSLFTGAAATAVLQSSSVVTLMTLSFVSASLMSLHSGIAVIFGSNVGTTATAWIVATLGFKVKIELFALPMIGAGGLLLAFNSSGRKVAGVAKVAIGFGLLFLGLDIMKTAIESFSTTLDFSEFADYPLIAFVAIGFVLTALIQSSSAATAIALSALYAQILVFDQAAAMVIGTNIGTTVTAILGAIGDIPDKKRAAAAHFLFNVITASVAFAMLPLLSHLLMSTLGMDGDPTTALALFHTIFNVIGVVLLVPFIGLLAKWLRKRFITKKPVATRFIHNVDPTIPDTAIVALRDEASSLFVKALKYALLLIHVKPGDLFIKKLSGKDLIERNREPIEFDHKKKYDAIKEIEIAIAEFISRLNQQNLSLEQAQSVEKLLVSVRESVYAAKILKDVKNNVNEFSESEQQSVLNLYDAIRANLAYTILILINGIQERWDRDAFDAKLARSREENMRILKEGSQLVSDPGVNDRMVVSLLNTNRSVYIAMQSLQDASEAVLLTFSLEEML